MVKKSVSEKVKSLRQLSRIILNNIFLQNFSSSSFFNKKREEEEEFMLCVDSKINENKSGNEGRNMREWNH